MIAIEKKIAWAWLDKAIGRNPQTREAPTLTPQQRTALLERSYEELKDELIGSINAEIPGLLRAEHAIALEHDLDPTFLNWFLVNGKHWPSLPPAQRKGLRAVQSIYMWFSAVPDHWNNMQVPDISEGERRDAALADLADYFVKTSMPRIEKKFAKALWLKSRAILDAFRGPGATPDAKASLLLMRDFEKRLVADLFQSKPAVQQVVDLLG
jgi:hypothetical protein